ncbi:MAG: two-component regulator propeller domain-containing protein [Bryobacteraceae bacterium]
MTSRAACLILCLASLRAEQLPIRIYTTADGLAGNTIDRIVTDSHGFLWFCTREGLSRFDGYQFQNFGQAQGLPPDTSDLLEAADGDYWIATANGVARFHPASPNPEFKVYRGSNPESRVVNALAADPAGGIWAGTRVGLYHLDRTADDWQLRLVDIGLPSQGWEERVVLALLVDRNGTLWAATRTGLYRRFPDGRSEHTQGGTPQPVVNTLLQDRQGRLWAGTRRGVCRIAADRSLTGRTLEEACIARTDAGREPVEALFETSDGAVWIAAHTGLAVYRTLNGHEMFERFTAENGLPGYGAISALGEDRAGNLWMGAQGAIRVAKGGFRTYTQHDGLDTDNIRSILETADGRLCAITSGVKAKPVNCYDGRRFLAVRPNIPHSIDDWGWSRGPTTFQARSGEWWVATAMGVFRFPPLSTSAALGRARPKAVYAPGESVYATFEDSHGAVWISTQIPGPNGAVHANSLARWDPVTGLFHRYPAGQPIDGGVLATNFAEDGAGNLWIGLNSGGILRYRDGQFQKMEVGKRKWVTALAADRKGSLWVGTYAGLSRIDNPASAEPKSEAFTVANGLSSNLVESIAEDLLGRIYVGNGHGVDCIYPGVRRRIRHYTNADGLARGAVLAAFCDRHGVLWFGTREGLSRLEPEPEQPQPAPPVLISGLRVRGAPFPISALGETSLTGIELSSDRNQVALEFVGLGFGAGGELRYQYRLDRTDLDWSPETGQRTVNYANLGPGSYHWQVRALTSDGIASAPASVAFTILTPVWQRWWMRLLMLLAAALLLYSVYRYRMARLLEMERLRTRIATDLHDDIGSTLSQIALLSEVAQRRPAAERHEARLADIANLSRELVDSMSDIVWAIDPEQDRLGDLTHRMRRFANDLFSHNGSRVRLDLPGEDQNPHIGADIRRQVFLVFKESLHNAVRHSGCTEVDLKLRVADGWLDLFIADNGRGFDLQHPSHGHGLASMRRRSGHLGGELVVDSSPQRGTTVHLRAPLARPTAPIWKRSPHTWVGDLRRVRRMMKGDH